MKTIVLFLVVVFMFSCKREDKVNTKNSLIIGDWELTTKDFEPKDGTRAYPLETGYGFYADGSFENKIGFYNWKNPLKYYGSFSRYKLENDSLKMYNLYLKKWTIVHIAKLTTDSLVLEGEYFNPVYVKKHYDTIGIPQFQGLIISQSAGLISSQLNNIFIQSDGSIVYDKFDQEKNGLENKWYKAKISNKDFSKIQTRFKQANWPKLKSLYGDVIYDAGDTQICIINNGKIVKSVFIYPSDLPVTLTWAYMPALHITDVLKSKEITAKNLIGSDITIIGSDGRLALTSSESYFLAYSLGKAPSINKNFSELFKLDFQDDSLTWITTDGRLFKLYNKNKGLNTVDLGYNFITESKLVNTFQKKIR
jgi:hypothetical protein